MTRPTTTATTRAAVASPVPSTVGEEVDTTPRHRIGEVATQAGVSTRTLRYYQELGLLAPAGASPGGSRRYSDADVARLARVLELRNVMGFDLDRIGDILAAEDRLAELRREARAGITAARRRAILAEALSINAHLREQVADRQAVLSSFADELEATAARYRAVAQEWGIDLDRD